MADIKIEYDGEYPNLCSGDLTVTVDGVVLKFGNVLVSGGSVWFTEDWDEMVEDGPWTMDEDAWPKNFPANLVEEVMYRINEEIPHGCCGGCI